MRGKPVKEDVMYDSHSTSNGIEWPAGLAVLNGQEEIILSNLGQPRSIGNAARLS